MISFIAGKKISWGPLNVKQGANFFLEAGIMFYIEGGHLTPKKCWLGKKFGAGGRGAKKM